MDTVWTGRIAPVTSPAKDATGKKPAPHHGAIFIQDAVTPWGGETMLLALLRAQAKKDQDE
ncbi:hypothetical protein M3P21_02280 [Ruegeria sp. 2012CJ41-6]|uniref:Uncharacterized protein n=1 Tax=Ruegeria spongiae TaxID=2942209 RepID=A0ABT0PZJ2_9RHOB|nr:hypothetical protein [Ruegeria spongiae]MCL6282343.1 hypothetical protein [Ruegeria spongiae]